MEPLHVLSIVAAVCNVAAATINVLTARRNRRSWLVLNEMRGAFGRAIGFAAFVASKESGAPEDFRRLALAAMKCRYCPHEEHSINACVYCDCDPFRGRPGRQPSFRRKYGPK